MTDRLEEQVEALTERVLALETALHEEHGFNLGPEFEASEAASATLCEDCSLMFTNGLDDGDRCPWCGAEQTESASGADA